MPVTSQLFPFSVTSGPPESPFIFKILEIVIRVWGTYYDIMQNREIEPNLAGVNSSRHESFGKSRFPSRTMAVARRLWDDLNVGL